MLLKIKLTNKQKSDKSEEKYGFIQKRAIRYPLQKIKKNFLSGKAFRECSLKSILCVWNISLTSRFKDQNSPVNFTMLGCNE